MAPQLSGSLQTYLKYFNDFTLEIFKKTFFFFGWRIKRLRWKSARLLILPLLFSKTNVYLFIYMFAKPYFPETVVSFLLSLFDVLQVIVIILASCHALIYLQINMLLIYL